MISGLTKRIVALELAGPAPLPLDIRAWLGDYLTEAERAQLAIKPNGARPGSQTLPACFNRWLDERTA